MSRDVQIGQSLDFLFALLGDCEGEHGDVVAHDAPADGFPSAFSSAAGAVTFLVLVQEQSHSSLRKG